MSLRVRPPRDLETKVLDRMKDEGLVETKQKGLMLAAALGYKSGYQPDLETEFLPGEGIRLEYFERPRDDGLIDILAVCLKGTLQVLDEEEAKTRIELFERFAAEGLRLIEGECFGPGVTDPLLALVDLLEEPEAGAAALPGLDDELGEVLD